MLSKTFERTVVEAMPIPVFVVDDDVRIRDLNGAAVQFCGQNQEAVYGHRGGTVMRCLHSTDVPEGCGRGPACRTCIVRTSVAKCLEGQTVSRKRTNLQVRHDSAVKEVQLLVTASPLPDGKEPLVLLMVEDITELSTLKSLIPICMKCKKIRDDQQYWKALEEYFHEHIGIDFSHGVCPGCAEELYAEFRNPRV